MPSPQKGPESTSLITDVELLTLNSGAKPVKKTL